MWLARFRRGGVYGQSPPPRCQCASLLVLDILSRLSTCRNSQFDAWYISYRTRFAFHPLACPCFCADTERNLQFIKCQNRTKKYVFVFVGIVYIEFDYHSISRTDDYSMGEILTARHRYILISFVYIIRVSLQSKQHCGLWPKQRLTSAVVGLI